MSFLDTIHAPAAIVRCEPGGRWHLEAVNVGFAAVMGLKQGEGAGIEARALVSGAQWAPWAAALDRRAHGRSQRLPTPDGESLMAQLSPLSSEGEARRLLLIGHPVAPPVRTDWRANYEALFERLPTMMHSIDAQGRLLHVTDMWLSVMGYRREEVIGRRSTEFLTEASRQLAREVLPEFMRTGHCQNIPCQFITKAGQRIDVLLSATAEMGPDGEMLRSLAVLSDVTALKRLAAEREAALKASEEVASLTESILNEQTEMICRFLPDTTLLYVNEAYARAFDASPTELTGQRFLQFIPEADRPGVRAHLQKISDPAGSGRVTYEHRSIVRGRMVWQEWTDTALFDNEGHVLELQSIGRDITERKQAELSLTRANEKLAQANSDLEQFTRVAAHDLKAPLRGVRNLATWIEEDIGEHLTGETGQHFEHLVRRVERLDNLLDDLLAYARLGQRVDLPREVHVPSLAREVVELVGLSRGISVNVTGDAPPFTTQATPLSTTLRNLISNALKHHDRSEGCVDVIVSVDGAAVVVVVEDDGPGIPAKYHERVFQPFTTLKSRDVVEGSGMGLAIVRRIVELHGGQITLEAPIHPGAEGGERPRGTRFTVRWPIALPEGQEEGE